MYKRPIQIIINNRNVINEDEWYLDIQIKELTTVIGSLKGVVFGGNRWVSRSVGFNQSPRMLAGSFVYVWDNPVE